MRAKASYRTKPAEMGRGVRVAKPLADSPNPVRATERANEETSFLTELNERATLQTHVLDEILAQSHLNVSIQFRG